MSDPADPAPHAPSISPAPSPVVAGPWAAPSAPPFGAPAPGPAAHPAYAPPPGYTGPYRVAPPGGAQAALPAPGARAARSSRLGVVALVAALAAAIAAPLAGAIAAFNIGLGAGREIALRPMDIDFDWSVLTPVREWVLLAECSFYVGTTLGVLGIVQGIIAIVQNR